MPVAVVKLGSSIVAEESGELRLSVVARVCEEVAALRREGVDVVMVTSGAIARGMRLLGLGARPAAVQVLQAASAVGQGRLYRTYEGGRTCLFTTHRSCGCSAMHAHAASRQRSWSSAARAG